MLKFRCEGHSREVHLEYVSILACPGLPGSFACSIHCTQTPWDCHICLPIDPSWPTPTDRQSYGSPMECLGYIKGSGQSVARPRPCLAEDGHLEDGPRTLLDPTQPPGTQTKATTNNNHAAPGREPRTPSHSEPTYVWFPWTVRGEGRMLGELLAAMTLE